MDTQNQQGLLNLRHLQGLTVIGMRVPLLARILQASSNLQIKRSRLPKSL